MNGSFLSNIFRGAADDVARTMEPQLISDFLPRGAASEGGAPIYDKEARQILASGNLPDGIELINSGMGYDLVKLPEEILAGIDPNYKTSRF